MATYFYNPHPQEVEIRGSQIQVYPWPHGEFEDILKTLLHNCERNRTNDFINGGDCFRHVFL